MKLFAELPKGQQTLHPVLATIKAGKWPLLHIQPY